MRWFVLAAWRAQRGRWLTAAAAVAVGIALATAIFTVNRSALAEFQQAIDTINGEASLQIVGRAGMFDEQVFDAVLAAASAVGIEAASPVVSIEVTLPGKPGEAEARPRERLTVLGIDVFRAGVVSAALIPQIDSSIAQAGGAGSSLFADDAIFLSPAAQSAYAARPGDPLVILSGLARPVNITCSPPGSRVTVSPAGMLTPSGIAAMLATPSVSTAD